MKLGNWNHDCWQPLNLRALDKTQQCILKIRWHFLMVWRVAISWKPQGKNQNSKSHENNVAEILIDLIMDKNWITSGTEKVAAQVSFIPKFQKCQKWHSSCQAQPLGPLGTISSNSSEAKSSSQESKASATITGPCLPYKWSSKSATWLNFNGRS